MNPNHYRSVYAIIFFAFALMFSCNEANAQYTRYYYPAPSYGWNYQVSQPFVRSYVTPRTSSYRSTPRPAGGYGSNLHRNFTIRQEQLRSQRTGLPPRNRGNLRWVR